MINLMLFLFLILGCSASTQYIISAPDVFRLNQTENVSVVVMNTPGNNPIELSLHLEDAVNRRRFSEKSLLTYPGEPYTFQMRVSEDDLEDFWGRIHYVNLVAQSNSLLQTFEESTQILVTKRSHIVIVQLDKPIYTPLQEVHFRVYTMNLNMKPVQIPLLIDIVNPQDVVLATYDPFDPGFSSCTYNSFGILSGSYWFGDMPVFGKWKVLVKYGYKMQQVSEAWFELDEYILPTFAEEIKCPNVVLPRHSAHGLDIHISAKYLFGQSPPGTNTDEQEPVEFEAVPGTADIKVGLLEGSTIIFFYNETVQLNRHKIRQGGLKSTYSTKTNIEIQRLINDLEYTFEDLVGNRLYVEVTVTDQNSGLQSTEIQAHAIFSPYEFIIDLSQTPKYFKPGSFTLWMRTKYPNGATKKRARLTINVKAQSSKDSSWSALTRTDRSGRTANSNQVRSDDKGRAHYTFVVPHDIRLIEVEVVGSSKSMMNTFDGSASDEKSKAFFNATSYLSASKSFVHIDVNKITVEPSTELEVDVDFTFGAMTIKPKKYYYMLLGRGNILQHGARNMSDTSTSILYVNLPKDLAPSARLLVYFVQQMVNGNSEVIADAIWLEVDRKCAHQNIEEELIGVELETDRLQYRPSDNIILSFEANPFSEIALLAVDQAVYELNSDNILTQHKVFELLESLDTGCSPGGGEHSTDVFQGAGLTTINNLGMQSVGRDSVTCEDTFTRSKRDAGQRISSLKECCTQGVQDAVQNGKKSACRKQSARSSETADCKNQMYRCCTGHIRRPEKFPLPSGTIVTDVGTEDDWDWEPEFLDYNGIPARKKFPESFLFQTAPIGAEGIGEVNVNLPDTITTWVFHGVAVHKEMGICVAQTHNVTTFKKLFVKVNMPSSAVKGEQIVINATFYNYYDDYGGVAARAYLYVDYGICANARPHERSERVSLGKVKEKQAKFHSWSIIPLETGSFNITVVMQTPKGVDKVEKWLFVKPAGEIRNISIPLLLDPRGRASGYLVQSTTDAGIVSKHIYSKIQSDPPKQDVQVNVSALYDAIPQQAVPGTVMCSITVEGNVLAPTLDKLLHEDEVRSMWGLPKPSACGQQTLSKVVPTVLAALYLKSTRNLTKDMETKTQHLVKTSLERQLKFRQTDGSFSFWYSGGAKSTWLTALVVKLMALAATEFDVMLKLERQGQSTLGREVMCDAVEWLLNQQTDDGHFDEPYNVNKLQTRYVVGNKYDDTSLSAFVLIALSQAKSTVKTHCSKDISAQILTGMTYLESNVDTLEEATTEPFKLALVTYAIALLNSPQMYKANTALLNRMIFDEDLNIRYLPGDISNASTVEETAYALLAQVQLKEFDQAFAMVAWLLSERNVFGSYYSSQDTMVALEALTMYKISSKELASNLQCDLKLQDQTDPIESYTFNNDIYQLSHQRLLTPSEIESGDLMIKTTGEGYAQAFLNFQYYYLPPPSQKVDACPHFELEISNDNVRSYGFHEIRVCTRSLQKRDTGMGIIEIGLVTGQKVIKTSVENMINQISTVERLWYYEIWDTVVNLYFNKIPKDNELCVTIETQTYAEVTNTQPASVSVYDYYDPSKKCTKSYEGNQLPDQNRINLQYSCDHKGKCECEY